MKATMYVSIKDCNRLHGSTIKDCICRLANENGWLECPPEAKGVLTPCKTAFTHKPATELYRPALQLSGEICRDCGGLNMVRTGTCSTCLDCGWNAGCS